jgi:hypothetical protein
MSVRIVTPWLTMAHEGLCVSKFNMTALSLRGDVFPLLSHSPTPGCARMRMLFSLRGLTWGLFNEYGTWASVVSKCGLTALSAGRGVS